MKNRDEIAQALAASGYIADGELATAISLMQLLRRPLLSLSAVALAVHSVSAAF